MVHDVNQQKPNPFCVVVCIKTMQTVLCMYLTFVVSHLGKWKNPIQVSFLDVANLTRLKIDLK